MTKEQRLRVEAATRELAKVKAEVGEEVGRLARAIPKGSKRKYPLVEPTPFARLCTEYAALDCALAVLGKA